MKQEDYLDKIDIFKNTLLTQAKRISNLYDELEKNSMIHASGLNNNEQIKSWNNLANNIEEAVEVIELLVVDLGEYEKLWYDYFNVEE